MFNSEENKPEGILKKVARFFKYNKLFFVLTVLCLINLFAALFGDKGFLTRRKLGKDKEALEEQIKIEKKKQDSLKKVIDELNTIDSKNEKIAREKYGMTKEGESLYKIEIDSTK